MGSKRVRIALVGSAVALAGLLFLLTERTDRRQAGARPPAALGVAASPAAPAGAAAGANGRSELADGLNSPAGNVQADLRIVDQVFVAYRSALHSGNPTGENAEITAALAGRNRLGFAFIPPDNPAINAKGELCDRWGTPYFFHQLSGERMEVRSAGPDRRLWTEDDAVFTP
ncbi:MAG: hypothetical protein ABSH26_18180 [Opitutaceae bacterium]|jgi:hypothetical protein